MNRIRRTVLCLLLTVVLLAGAAWAAAPAETFLFAQQLNVTEKQFYDQIAQAQNLAALRSGDPIELAPITGNYSSDADLEAQTDAYMNMAINATAVYQREHPELFWVNGCYVRISYSMGGGGYTLRLKTGMYVTESWDGGARSIDEDERTIRSAVQSLATDAKRQGGSYAQLLYVHDWLAEHNAYNDRAAILGDDYHSSLPWSPLSALTDEEQPVCEGYARAFKLVCDELYIPCILVDGEAGDGPHMWNYVRLGGSWYGVDVTWDDTDGYGTKHDYFLVGANTPVDGAKTFSQEHFPNLKWLTNRELAYPALAADACPRDVQEETPAGPFSDVRADDYFAQAVIWAKDTGVTDGTTLTTFSPANTVKRGQAVPFLWRAMGEPEPMMQVNPFSDVKASEYFCKAVLWAVENGITDGTGDTTFSPEKPVTRGQMITFLWRTLGKPGETGAGPWYADAENWGNLNGFLAGTAESYTTAANCPRGDVVYYLWQAVA